MANSQDLKDPQRFEIFNRHRGLLFSIAYRMLGSAADAEDMVQESYIRWRQAADTEIRSPRAVLVTVVSSSALTICNQREFSAKSTSANGFRSLWSRGRWTEVRRRSRASTSHCRWLSWSFLRS